MIPGNLYSGIEWILLGLVNSGQIRGTAAEYSINTVQKSCTVYIFRHQVGYWSCRVTFLGGGGGSNYNISSPGGILELQSHVSPLDEIL